ncbi:helicase-related protein [Halalkalibacter urbisdiaboli]|uniref:helicase-related protein n=1 Tax=Halalkalibacter urbisdiaboli TaxID=1960589 RepID=UPI000B43EE9D|nr:helicase-related protein [Halalkalibacter urbisdiaboli]
MIRYKTLLEDVFAGRVKPKRAIDQLNESKADSPIDYVVRRILNCYSYYLQTESGLRDFLANLRQYLLITNSRLQMPETLYRNILTSIQYFGISPFHFDDVVEVSCSAEFPSWLEVGEEINSVYKYQPAPENRVAGDGYLFHMTGYEEYTSKGQKYLAHAAITQKEGSTLIAALRTGGGKSLVFQMPAFYDKSGVTVVIVPTVSLTMDQQQNIAAAYTDNELSVRVIHSGVSNKERKEIEKELKDGTVSLVFTSPEVVLRPWFKQVLFDLATDDQLNRLVIDEAHIIDEWGDLFRIDFQLLAVIRKKLLELTNGRLKTILLSATLSEESTELLKELFSEKTNLVEIRTDTLRDEIQYYYKHCEGISKRNQYFRELLPKIPRPFIVYVGTRADAEKYASIIQDEQYNRVAVFTGDTSNDDRQEIISRWKNDEIDIIIATSAFGVGMDKKDVRAVVHLYMPPSIDRFYQEVGRGGRDGFPSLSISLLFQLEDIKLVNHLTNSKVLTTEKIREKFIDLIQQPISVEGGDKLVVNTMVKPLNRMEEFTGRLFANWYGYVLLFLNRNNLIEILDAEWIANSEYNVMIKIKDLDITNPESDFLAKIEIPREAERNKINDQVAYIRKMFKKTKNTCFGLHFENVYPYTTRACRTCPSCREKQKRAIFSKQHITISDGRKGFLNYLKHYRASDALMLRETIYEFEGEFNPLYLSEHHFDMILVEDRNEVMFNYLNKSDVIVYEFDEVLGGDDIILSGVISVVMKSSSSKTDKIYSYIKNNQRHMENNKYIYISKKDLIINNEARKLRDLVDGPIKYCSGGLHADRY